MFESLPASVQAIMDWEWPDIEPYFEDLAGRPLTESSLDEWLADWSRLAELLAEWFARVRVAVTLDTTDEAADRAYNHYLQNIFPPAQKAGQTLNLKLLDSGLEPDGFGVALRNIRAEVELFREANLPLLVQDRQLSAQYDRIIGGQTIEWDGQEMTMAQLATVSHNPDRAVREAVWRRASARVLADRQAINEVWVKLMAVRSQTYRNADLPDYRAYAWKNRQRFTYTPEDCETFHAAIEQVVVPAARRVYERQRERMGAATLRPWDVNVDPMRTTEMPVDPLNRPPLRPFTEVSELVETCGRIFDRVDGEIGRYFAAMRANQVLDLANYKGKAPGAYCMSFPVARTPFIFMNAVGTHENVTTLLHEAGHAFHVFESQAHQPLIHLRNTPMEFNEVASMAMELLAAPYLLQDEAGFYDSADYARARADHLERILIFWPYMAVVDSFQHWAYTHHDQASDPANCDAAWGELWDRFIQGVDWAGLEEEKVTGWQRKLHIFRYPFYYVEYGLAQLGAVQVWRNALTDQARAVADYRRALALGGTVTLPELFAAAGARFAFDAQTLGEAVDLIESTIDRLS
jgi:oligoendopeptidase F